MLYLFGSRERLEAGCLGYHGVAVAGAGLQWQGQAWNGVNPQLCDWNLVVCDWEFRLPQHRIHRQRRLHLQRRRCSLIGSLPDRGTPFKNRNDKSFVVFLKLINPWQANFALKCFVHLFVPVRLESTCQCLSVYHSKKQTRQKNIKIKKKAPLETEPFSNQTTRQNPKQSRHGFKACARLSVTTWHSETI